MTRNEYHKREFSRELRTINFIRVTNEEVEKDINILLDKIREKL